MATAAPAGPDSDDIAPLAARPRPLAKARRRPVAKARRRPVAKAPTG